MDKLRARKPEKFQTYAREAFEKSLITSLPEIATEKNRKKRCLKLTVFVLCVIGLVYQTTEFLQLYFSYPTVTDIEITSPSAVERPALTFCNSNARRRSVICEKTECECETMKEEEMCEMYPQFCNLYKQVYLKVPVGFYDSHPCLNFKREWKDAYAESHTNYTVFHCMNQGEEGLFELCKEPYTRIPVREIVQPYALNVCYCIDSQVGDPNAQPTFKASMYNMEVIFQTEPNEYLNPKITPSVQVAIHDRKEITNPYFDGTMLRGGLCYIAHVSMTETRRLPPPYQTKCVDYRALWRERNGTGPLSRKMCVEYCKLKTVQEMGLCVDEGTYYPNDGPVCMWGWTTMTRDILKHCSESCGKPCFDQKFDVLYQEAGDSKCRHQVLSEWCIHYEVELKVSYKRYTLTSISYQPKFESVEVFSYIGGYIGMWIGLSLVSLFDLFETLLHLAYYPVQRIKSKPASRRNHARVVAY